MSKLSDYARAILAGGLPAALDMGSRAGAAQGDNRTEQIAPSGTIQDRDNAAPVSTSILAHVTGKEIAIAAAGLIVVGAVLFVTIRFVKKI
jgi:hypothetical protein